MSVRERAQCLFDMLTDKQLEAFLTLFGTVGTVDTLGAIEEEEPDEIDLEMIRNKDIDNDKGRPLDDFVRELGLNPDDYRI